MKQFLKIYILGLIVIVSEMSVAQQLPIYNQYNYNQFVYNPALSGKTKVSVMTLLHRNQWSGVDGAPETSLISFNSSEQERNVGYAVYMYNDKTGVLSTTSFYGSYSYSFTAAEGFDISLGLSGGAINKGVDATSIRVTDPNDPVLNTDISGKTVFDFNFGFNLSYEGFDFGFAAPQLFANSVDYSESNNTDVSLKLQRHYISNLSYTYPLEMKSLGKLGNGMTLKPQVLARIAPLLERSKDEGFSTKPSSYKAQFDIHTMVDLPELGWVGLGYRTEMGVIANLGVNITRDLSVGYSYEFNTSEVSSELGSTHELALIYRFGAIDRLRDEFSVELAELKKEEIARLNQREIEYKRAQDSIMQAMKNGIIINANDIIEINSKLDSLGVKEVEHEDDLSATASNVIGGSKGFYVISGVFSYSANAEAQFSKLQSEGYDVDYFFNKENKFYYVFLRKYKTIEMAMKVKDNHLQGAFFDDLWVKEVE